MAKADVTVRITPIAQRIADEMAYELVEVCLEKEAQGKYLRVYLDRDEGISLDDCERFHRAIMPLVEDYDYDFLEVSSPGIDRPLKTERDFERHLGDRVELKFYKPIDGTKLVQGVLTAFENDDVTIELNGEKRTYEKRVIAVAKPIVDMEGVETLELSEE